MNKKDWCVYMVECLDMSYYTGITNSIEKRMNAHKKGNGSKYILSRGFGRLISFKKCENKSEALKLEYKIKQMCRDEKLKFFK
jgi:putative endonuclease